MEQRQDAYGSTQKGDEPQNGSNGHVTDLKKESQNGRKSSKQVSKQQDFSKSSTRFSRGFKINVVDDQADLSEQSRTEQNFNIKSYLEDADAKKVGKQFKGGEYFKKYAQKAENDERENLEAIFESDSEGYSRAGSDRVHGNNSSVSSTMGRQSSDKPIKEPAPIKKWSKGFTISANIFRYVLQVLFVALFVAAIILKTSPESFNSKYDGRPYCAGIVDLWKILLFVGGLGVNYLLSSIISRAILVILKQIMPPRFYWYFAVPIRHQFRMVLMVVFMWVTFGVTFYHFNDGRCLCSQNPKVNYANFTTDPLCAGNSANYGKTLKDASNGILCIFIFVIANVLKRIFTKVLAARDHGTRQFQRGLESLFAEFIIIVLYTPKGDQKLAAIDDMILKWHLPLIKAMEDPDFAQQVQLRDALQKHIEIHSIKFFNDLTKKNRTEKQMKKQATKITQRIYKNVCANKDEEEKNFLTKADFEDYFPKTFVDKAYSLFDMNDDGQVGQEECVEIIHNIFQDRVNLRKTIRDQNNIYGKLENIIGMVLFFISAMTSLFIWNYKIGNVWTIFTGSAAIISLVLADPIKRFIESTIFLFLIRPFDIGDWIVVGTDIFQVQKIHLMDMVFKRTDGSKFFYPNNLLYTVRIANLSQSDGWIDSFTIVVDMNTPINKLNELFERIKSYVQSTPQDHEDFFLTQIVPSDVPFKVQVQLICQYKSNMKDGLKVLPMKTRFFQKVMQQCADVGITFTLPPTKGGSSMDNLKTADIMSPQRNIYGGMYSINQQSQLNTAPH